MTSKLFALLTATLLVGCESDRIEKLEKQNQEILLRLGKLEKASTFDAQIKCAQDAKSYYKDEYVNPMAQEFITGKIFFSDFNSHYSDSQNKCSLKVEQHLRLNPNDPAFDGIITIADVYGHREFGRYQGSHRGTDEINVFNVYDCHVNEVKCKSLDEFYEAIDTYMTK